MQQFSGLLPWPASINRPKQIGAGLNGCSAERLPGHLYSRGARLIPELAAQRQILPRMIIAHRGNPI
jgi:hypothetical protein